MRKSLIVWAVLILAVAARAETGFVKTLPADDFATAGLQKLTPAELAKLERLVERYKTGVTVAEAPPAPAVAPAPGAAVAAAVPVAQQDLEQKVVVAEAKVREAETKAQVAETKAREAEAKAVAAEAKAQAAVTAPKPAATPAKKEPSWLAALVTLDRAAAKPDKAEPLESRLVGDFRGWSGQTVFTLENGTRWVQQNKVDHYDYSPALHAPLVKIKPSSVSGFWLEVKGVNSRVRVIPLSLPD